MQYKKNEIVKLLNPYWFVKQIPDSISLPEPAYGNFSINASFVYDTYMMKMEAATIEPYEILTYQKQNVIFSKPDGFHLLARLYLQYRSIMDLTFLKKLKLPQAVLQKSPILTMVGIAF